ncbi:uncharacterized protein JCM6883_000869 [Sporobolomyces salmoneus]|uniref:uncharacterized protein n=1 Tax=Sporobolomyces salmoneus TaxID=183962 RepID=UPI00316DB114
MASSLSESCNAPKHHYDTCFNHWLKSYLLLVAPPLSNPSDTPAGVKEREKRMKALNEKKEELENKCGKQYREYQDCLKTAIKGVDGLPELLAGARREEPLDGWGGIKLTTEEDQLLLFAPQPLHSTFTLSKPEVCKADVSHSFTLAPDLVTAQVLQILNSTLTTFDKYSDKASVLLDQVKGSDNRYIQYCLELLNNPTLQAYYNKTTSYLLSHLPYVISFIGLALHLLISQFAHTRRTRREHSRSLQFKADMTDHYGLGTFARNAMQGMQTNATGAKDDFGVVEVQWGREKIRVPLPPPSSPLSTLKAALYNITGVPPTHQKLIYSGAVLKDDLAPLTAFGLVNEESTQPSSSNDDDSTEGGKLKSFWDSWSFTGKNSTSQKKIKKLVMLGSKDVSARIVDDRLSTRKDLQDLKAAAGEGSERVETEKKVESEETISKRIKQISTEKLAELEPQVTQVEGWIVDQKKERAEAEAGGEGEGETKKAGPPPRILLYLSEILLQGLLKLDSIEIPSGYENARKERKEAVKQVQDVLDRVDRAKEDWKKSGLS